MALRELGVIDEKLEDIADPELYAALGEALFRVIEYPHSPRGLIWFEQRVGPFRGDRVVQLAPNWFLTYRFVDESPAGECLIFVFALGEAPPR